VSENAVATFHMHGKFMTLAVIVQESKVGHKYNLLSLEVSAFKDPGAGSHAHNYPLGH